jgi:chromosome segregation ATPase
MKNRLGVIICVLVCLGLSIALIAIKKQASDQETKDNITISSYSNQWVDVNSKWEEQKAVSAMQEKDLETQKKAFGELTNNYAKVSADLSQASADLAKTQTELKSREEEVTQRDTKINELEARNEALDKQAFDLSTSITNMTAQIAETQKKLAASEGDKAFLEGELKRLITEKKELERQFNDLAVLRAQVSKLKEELTIARRLEWIRQGLFASEEQKGAQHLMQHAGSAQGQAQARASKPIYDLNVEVGADGSVKVIPPLTNAPATNPPPAK